MDKKKVGIVGCGNICDIYFKNIKKFEVLELAACSDLIRERAEKKAREYDVPVVCSTGELLENPNIDIVVNLTTPPSHAEICLSGLKAGKNVYVEKPLAIAREDGAKILETARKNNLLVGGAPDTFLGGGIQTCRKIIDDGWIGDPVSATAFMACHGHESWHPDPEFYYKTGGGPMFDMGPYYLTALVCLLGPIERVTGATGKAFEERTITSEAKYGDIIEVDVPTHVTGLLDFKNGAIGSIITSFDVWRGTLPRIEIYGTRGSLSVPDPNTFGGPVSIFRPGAGEWKQIPLSHGFAENSRGIGVADMAHSLNSGAKPRAGGELTYHVLDVMHSIHEASDAGKHVPVGSVCEQPAPLPMGLTGYTLDE